MGISIAQIIIFIGYVSLIVSKFGILPSISESWYKLEELGGTWYSLFTWFCFSLGFLMFFQTNGESPYLFVLSGAGFSLVGVATLFKTNYQKYYHYIGAMVGILSALIAIGVERDAWIPSIIWAVGTIIIGVTKLKNETWWIEILAFLNIGIGLLLTS